MAMAGSAQAAGACGTTRAKWQHDDARNPYADRNGRFVSSPRDRGGSRAATAPLAPTVALLLVSLLASAVAQGQPPPAPEATSASHAAMPDVGKGAEEVAAQLRQLTESLSDTAVFASLEAEVAADTHGATERWNETGDLLKTNLRPAALDSLESTWQALRSQLEDVRDRIDARARRLTADLETLAKLHESWARSLDLAQKTNAPAPVLERARSTLAAIDAARPPIEDRKSTRLN